MGLWVRFFCRDSLLVGRVGATIVVGVVGVLGLVNSGKGVKGSKGKCEKSKVVAGPEKLFWPNVPTDDESKMLFPWKASDWIFTCLPAALTRTTKTLTACMMGVALHGH